MGEERLSLPQKFEKVYEQQKKNEPYLCNKRTFQLIYTIEKRRAGRKWHQACLAKLRLRYKRLRQEDVEAASRKLLDILTDNIRKCDVLTRFKRDYFILLLSNIRAQDVSGVISRIEEKYNYEPVYCSKKECWLNLGNRCKLGKLNKKHECKKLYKLRKLDLEWEYYQIS
ncbi:MAG: hypothetical protein ACQEQG_02360 [Bacillota bacterium]